MLNFKLKASNNLRNSELNYPLLGVEVTALVVLFMITINEAKPPLFDEIIYLKDAQIMQQQGLIVEVIKNSEVAVGPLTSLLHYFLEPLTHFEIPGIRFVNLILLSLMILINLLILDKFRDSKQALTQSLSILAIPTTWVISGMALSEIPSMFCITFSIFLVFLVIEQNKISNSQKFLLSLLGGIFFGLSILGRQSFLCLYLAFPLLFINRKEHLSFLIVFLVSSLILPLSLFSLWGGIVSPFYQRPDYMTTSSISLINGFLSYAYAAVMIAILAPRFFYFRYRRKAIAIISLILVSLNSIVHFVKVEPLKSLAQSILPNFLLVIYINLISSILVVLGLIFFLSLIRYIWQNRYDKISLFLGVATLLILATPFKIVHLYSSRYTATAIPLLILLTDPFNQDEKRDRKLIRLTVAMILGFFVLKSFYWSN